MSKPLSFGKDGEVPVGTPGLDLSDLALENMQRAPSWWQNVAIKNPDSFARVVDEDGYEEEENDDDGQRMGEDYSDHHPDPTMDIPDDRYSLMYEDSERELWARKQAVAQAARLEARRKFGNMPTRRAASSPAPRPKTTPQPSTSRQTTPRPSAPRRNRPMSLLWPYGGDAWGRIEGERGYTMLCTCGCGESMSIDEAMVPEPAVAKRALGTNEVESFDLWRLVQKNSHCNGKGFRFTFVCGKLIETEKELRGNQPLPEGGFLNHFVVELPKGVTTATFNKAYKPFMNDDQWDVMNHMLQLERADAEGLIDNRIHKNQLEHEDDRQVVELRLVVWLVEKAAERLANKRERDALDEARRLRSGVSVHQVQQATRVAKLSDVNALLELGGLPTRCR
jgi:hypothetical protein